MAYAVLRAHDTLAKPARERYMVPLLGREKEGNMQYARGKPRWGQTVGALCGALWVLVGCHVVGPASLNSGRPAYNAAINRTNDEQMLMGLVRLRYGEAVGLLAVTSVTANLRFRATAGTELSAARTILDDHHYQRHRPRPDGPGVDRPRKSVTSRAISLGACSGMSNEGSRRYGLGASPVFARILIVQDFVCKWCVCHVAGRTPGDIGAIEE
jgi:hypothetical protein